MHRGFHGIRFKVSNEDWLSVTDDHFFCFDSQKTSTFAKRSHLLRIMKHTHKYLIFAISIFLVSLLTLGCQEKKKKRKSCLSILFEQKKDTYPIFNETLKRTFDKPDSIERYCRFLESYEHRHRAQ